MTLSGADIREKFINFFKEKKGHLHLPSSSLIPDNPTLLLTSAGMVQFVPIFLGNAKPTNPPRATTVQKCARAGGKDSDIENIGRTSRHHSFFEMLGNFSFGDYFKKEIIPWSWEFVTKDLGLEESRLIVTVFEGDDEVDFDQEAYDLWHKVVGVPESRIFKMSKKDNFWGPPGPTGPCGPCSEIYYDRGVEFSKKENAGETDEIDLDDDDRYVEFWNLVFMELYKDENGKFTPLEKKNVDTGMGLDRVTMILQNKNNTFETDLLSPVLDEVSKISGIKYNGGILKGLPKTKEEKFDSYLKIISDHARCVTFLIGDGVRTSNVGRGYVLRFIIRRAARFGRLLGINEPFLHKLVDTITRIYGDSYPELKENEKVIVKHIKEEEERFAKTIDRGMTFLDDLLDGKTKELSGKEVFNLYATYGFPVELTEEIALEHNKTISMDEFRQAKKEHEEVSSVNKFSVVMTGEEALGDVLRKSGETSFTGYGATDGEGEVVAILMDGKPVEEISEGDEVDIVLSSTPFYAESGGQLGDQGRLESNDATLKVLDTQKHEGLHIHRVKALAGSVRNGDIMKAFVDQERRKSTVLHHSSAHIFHSAVRERLGKHVVQAGSQVGPSAMRFDFTFERQPTKEELADIESMMNEWVRENSAVKTEVMSLDDAKKTGALAMFGEKYGDEVRVISMGDFSLEFCGGTHVDTTGTIGLIKLISEGSISSGVRRVEALSGTKAWNYIQDQINYLGQASEALKARPEELKTQIEKMKEQIKAKDKRYEELEEKLAMLKLNDLMAESEKIGDTNVIVSKLDGISADSLKNLAASIIEKGDYVVILGAPIANDKVSLVCGVSKPLTKNGINAGQIIKEVATICGGGGGGRPDLAQAGGKDPEKLGEALNFGKNKVADLVKNKVNS